MSIRIIVRALALLALNVGAHGSAFASCNDLSASINGLTSGSFLFLAYGDAGCVLNTATLRDGARFEVSGDLDIGGFDAGGGLIPAQLRIVGAMQVDGGVTNYGQVINGGSSLFNLIMTSNSSWFNVGSMQNNSGIISYGYFELGPDFKNNNAIYSYGVLRNNDGDRLTTCPDCSIVVRGDLQLGGIVDSYGQLILDGHRSYDLNGHATGDSGSQGTINLYSGHGNLPGSPFRNASDFQILAGTTLTVGNGWSGHLETVDTPDSVPVGYLRTPSSLRNSGTLIIASLGSVSVGTLANENLLNNAGVLVIGGTLSNTGILINSGYLQFAGKFQPGYFGNAASTLGGTLENTGTLVIYNGSVTGTGSFFQSAGSTQLYGVNMSIGLLEVTGGTFCASGSIAAAAGVHFASNAITLCPGNSPGALRIGSDLLFERANLEIQIAGTAAGDYDTLLVEGRATFVGGKLKIVFVDGYLPQVGDTWSFLTLAGGSTGLATLGVSYDGLADGYEFSIALSDVGATLTTVGVPAAVPEPGQATLALLGLCFMGVTVRHRQAGRLLAA